MYYKTYMAKWGREARRGEARRRRRSEAAWLDGEAGTRDGVASLHRKPNHATVQTGLPNHDHTIPGGGETCNLRSYICIYIYGLRLSRVNGTYIHWCINLLRISVLVHICIIFMFHICMYSIIADAGDHAVGFPPPPERRQLRFLLLSKDASLYIFCHINVYHCKKIAWRRTYHGVSNTPGGHNCDWITNVQDAAR